MQSTLLPRVNCVYRYAGIIRKAKQDLIRVSCGIGKPYYGCSGRQTVISRSGGHGARTIRRKPLSVPEAEEALSRLKYEIAAELGLPVGSGYAAGAADAQDAEFASELGSLPAPAVGKDYWGHVAARDAGAVAARRSAGWRGGRIRRWTAACNCPLTAIDEIVYDSNLKVIGAFSARERSFFCQTFGCWRSGGC